MGAGTFESANLTVLFSDGFYASALGEVTPELLDFTQASRTTVEAKMMSRKLRRSNGRAVKL
jgi:hypothetical protein